MIRIDKNHEKYKYNSNRLIYKMENTGNKTAFLKYER